MEQGWDQDLQWTGGSQPQADNWDGAARAEKEHPERCLRSSVYAPLSAQPGPCGSVLCGQVDSWGVQLQPTGLQGWAERINELSQPALSPTSKVEQMGPGAGVWGAGRSFPMGTPRPLKQALRSEAAQK